MRISIYKFQEAINSLLPIFKGDNIRHLQPVRPSVTSLPTGGRVDTPQTSVPIQVEVFGRRQPSGSLYSILRAHGHVKGVTAFGDVQTDVPHDLFDRVLGANKVRVRVSPDSQTERVFWFEPHDSKNTPRWPFGAVLHNDGGQITLGVQKGSARETLNLQSAIPLLDTVPAPVCPQPESLM